MRFTYCNAVSILQPTQLFEFFSFFQHTGRQLRDFQQGRFAIRIHTQMLVILHILRGFSPIRDATPAKVQRFLLGIAYHLYNIRIVDVFRIEKFFFQGANLNIRLDDAHWS